MDFISRNRLPETGADIEIIEGNGAAAIIYSSHISRTFRGDQPMLCIDVGGGLREWIDLSRTLQSANALCLEETRIVLSDTAAYANFLEVLELEAKDFIESYKQNRKPFSSILCFPEKTRNRFISMAVFH